MQESAEVWGIVLRDERDLHEARIPLRLLELLSKRDRPAHLLLEVSVAREKLLLPAGERPHEDRDAQHQRCCPANDPNCCPLGCRKGDICINGRCEDG